MNKKRLLPKVIFNFAPMILLGAAYDFEDHEFHLFVGPFLITIK